MRIAQLHPAQRRFVAVVFMLSTASAAAERDSTSEALRLTVAPEHYVVGSARFSNVASVQAWLLFKGAHVSAIDRCTSATERRVLAAVERLYPAPGDTVELGTLPPTASACTRDWSASDGRETRGFLGDEDYLETDESGRSLIP